MCTSTRHGYELFASPPWSASHTGRIPGCLPCRELHRRILVLVTRDVGWARWRVIGSDAELSSLDGQVLRLLSRQDSEEEGIPGVLDCPSAPATGKRRNGRLVQADPVDP